jgi:uncharacterized protein YeaO (DUF488 family)
VNIPPNTFLFEPHQVIPSLIRTKRIYDLPSKDDDGCRILVDRLWPRGISRNDAEIDLWLKDVAPSHELRRWFSHRPERWSEFKSRYFQELAKKDKKLCKKYAQKKRQLAL